MKAPRILFSLLALAALSGGTVNAQTAKTQFVYLIGKTDVQHVVLSPVLEVPVDATREDLLVTFQAQFPQIADVSRFEGLRFATQAEAEEDLAAMQQRYVQAGKTVDMLKR